MIYFIKEYWKRITTDKVLSAFIVLLIAVVIVGSISFSRYSDSNFLEGILIEAHGMLLDIFILGFFILWLNRLGEKKMEVQRYINEIDDFRHWESDEAKFRIVGNINRLIRLKISAIDISYCTLNGAILGGTNLQGAKLRGTMLQKAILMNANLQDVSLQGAILQDAILMDAKLQRADLRGADLRGAKLRNAKLQGAKLQFSNLQGADLKNVNLQDANLQDANLQDANLQSVNITIEQIAEAKTLYRTELDGKMRKQIEENYPQLLAKPDWFNEKDE